MSKIILFDAYGTLLDVSSIDQKLAELYGDRATEIGQLWRKKQLEYSWLREVMSQYKPFKELTQDALIYTLKRLQIPISENDIKELMHSYDELKVYPEVKFCLAELGNKYKLGVLSNANETMLEAALSFNKVHSMFDVILSANQVQHYKPHSSIYQIAVDELSVSPQEVVFVTANAWDAAGAKTYGYQVAWINRNQWPVEELGVTPDWIIDSLQKLPSSFKQ